MNYLISLLLTFILSVTNMIIGARFHKEINEYLDLEIYEDICSAKDEINKNTNEAVNEKKSKNNKKSKTTYKNKEDDQKEAESKELD